MAKKKRKRKRRLKIKNILIFLIVFLLFCAFVCFLIFMPIANIYVVGNEILTDEVIIEESHLSDYPSFLLTSSIKIKNDLKKNNYIEDVVIKKKLNNIVEVIVKEYEAIAIMDTDGKILLSNGNLVDNVYNISDIARINNSIPDDIRMIFSERFSKIDKDILRQISQIEYQPVKVDNERFLLYMDDGNLVYVTLTKIRKMNKYNKIKDKLGGKIGIIYLDSGDYVEFKDNKAVVNEKDKKE